MARTERVVAASPERVFAVLADGWTYADWVVGTAHIRDVDSSWPALGSRLHHKVGPWPLSTADVTHVVRCEAPYRLVMRARMWPLGEAVVDFRLVRLDAASTLVTLVEDFTRGPLLAFRNKLNDLLLHGRNKEALSRLADFAENRENTYDARALAEVRLERVARH
ncbi:SRPBCC family protein [Catellatospora paridis]|uniref:SRPBCC family protein n=1 Tax=Catellatospora paridis TaxID=1617086 RepID=UPI0012D3738A|nr:SRPBCC family protein [Catellatospora paridis]